MADMTPAQERARQIQDLKMTITYYSSELDLRTRRHRPGLVEDLARCKKMLAELEGPNPEAHEIKT